MQEYNYIPLDTIRRYEPEMERLKVSEVARSPRGFLTAYKKANGNRNNLSEYWKIKRHGFIRRHLVQYKENPTIRRKLSLIAWAFMPD
jgi:hypothetical protein